MRLTKELVILNFVLLFIGIPSALRAQSDGALPIPVFTDVTIDATVSHDAPTDRLSLDAGSGPLSEEYGGTERSGAVWGGLSGSKRLSGFRRKKGDLLGSHRL